MSKPKEGSDFSPGLSEVRLRPLPVALRLDLSIPTGRGGVLKASRMVWVLPRNGARWVEAFEALILPN